MTFFQGHRRPKALKFSLLARQFLVSLVFTISLEPVVDGISPNLHGYWDKLKN